MGTPQVSWNQGREDRDTNGATLKPASAAFCFRRVNRKSQRERTETPKPLKKKKKDKFDPEGNPFVTNNRAVNKSFNDAEENRSVSRGHQ